MSDPDPNTLRVGALDFAVWRVSRAEEGGKRFDAKIDHSSCTIAVDDSLVSQTKRVVIWHEVLHSILVQAGITDHDEKVIRAMSYGIVAALRDNPSLHGECNNAR